MEKIISCDWGTSALRLRTIDIKKMAVLAEAADDQGVSGTFNLWKQSGRLENERVSFYQGILTGQIRKMEEQSGTSLQDLPLIISGMASSSIGMTELPYAEVPLNTSGGDLYVKISAATNDFRHKMFLISGVKNSNDVMRGEETQLIGCLDGDKEDRLFIFPGTHSKHVIVRNEKIIDITTFMTGEFFELLSKKSILSNAVEESRGIPEGDSLKSFEMGVIEGSQANLLHSSFTVRTNDLFKTVSKRENYFYLSGLLIGTELKELPAGQLKLTIVGDESLAQLYSLALKKSGRHVAEYRDGSKAVIEGHCKIYHLYKAE